MDTQFVKSVMFYVLAFAVFVVVPLVMLLLYHQRKMTELIGKNNIDAAQLSARIESLERRLEGDLPPLGSSAVGEPEGHRTVLRDHI